MPLDSGLVDVVTKGSIADAWSVTIKKVLEISSRPLSLGSVPHEVVKRDREIGDLDLLLSSSSWDLWQAFSGTVERNSTKLLDWWAKPFSAKAVLILDGLSLRELPWLLQGAQDHGLSVHDVSANASEMPGETDEFAQALGFGSRSQLQNNSGGSAHKLQPAHTESVDLPWKDCEALISGASHQVFWHHWPDSKVHDGAGAGQGLALLARDAASQLNHEEFWSFVKRMATGRRLVITSDHGYAATGYFPDAEGELGQFLKKAFSSGRCTSGVKDAGPFVPPVALQVSGPHGAHLLALGRWKWKNQGGYPTLTHGGLSLLEVLCPFIELTK
ncbi:hypothetical protein DYQ86_09575 [Acidobacteria bacterium AB60]|nr:hypothetical protein DYQ86_09575 [Acidobacteria bacterium AB60]